MKKIKQHLEKYKIRILALTFLSILFEFLFLSSSSSLPFLLITAWWFFLVLFYKFERRISIGSGLVFLSFVPILLIFKNKELAEKAAIWAYDFLFVGIIQTIWADWKENNKKTE